MGREPWFLVFANFGGLNPPSWPLQTINMKLLKVESERELSFTIGSQEQFQHNAARGFQSHVTSPHLHHGVLSPQLAWPGMPLGRRKLGPRALLLA